MTARIIITGLAIAAMPALILGAMGLETPLAAALAVCVGIVLALLALRAVSRISRRDDDTANSYEASDYQHLPIHRPHEF